ncbi:CocE/NonD family hydrolase [Lentzea sp. NPDC051213]|uniref:CocE/NonD family hydrolase n=1 Tax=Lentzea sp. NPDC051213 TaxID=3364126 RepID=UPI0037993F32
MRERKAPFRGLAHLLGALLLVLASVAAPAAAHSSWVPQPEPASYGRSQPVAVSVTMDDGVVLAAQVAYPTDPVTGERAPGEFPVLISQNPYGAGPRDPFGGADYLVKRGYIYVVSAVRGSGASGGQLDWFGARQGKDGAALVNWAARSLTGSDGNVGLDGCSYLGVNQWFTAAAVGKHSPLKAIAPFCTDSDFYNDLAAAGGIPTTFVPGIGRAIPRGPQDDPLTDPLSVTVNDLRNGGPRSYNNEYWHALNVQELLPKIVANGVPALSQSGWNDLFPGGNLGAYVAAQNAYYGRPLHAPIRTGQPVTGRYQAIVGPWTHGQHVTGDVLANIRKEWFDTWLKRRPTGMAKTAKPLHVFQNGASRWVDTAAWPPSPRTETFYLNDNSALTTTKPATPGTDALSWSTPSPLTYTTAPLPTAKVLDGPINVSVHLTSTTPDAQVTATVNLVAPDGSVTKQGGGVLLAGMRELDTRQSWYGTGHSLIKAAHPFTQSSQRLLTPGEAVRMDISVLANFTLIPAGHRLQVVLSSQAPDFHLQLAPTPQQRANLELGQYRISRAPGAASSITLPLAPPGMFATSPVNWGPSY